MFARFTYRRLAVAAVMAFMLAGLLACGSCKKKQPAPKPVVKARVNPEESQFKFALKTGDYKCNVFFTQNTAGTDDTGASVFQGTDKVTLKMSWKVTESASKEFDIKMKVLQASLSTDSIENKEMLDSVVAGLTGSGLSMLVTPDGVVKSFTSDIEGKFASMAEEAKGDKKKLPVVQAAGKYFEAKYLENAFKLALDFVPAQTAAAPAAKAKPKGRKAAAKTAGKLKGDTWSKPAFNVLLFGNDSAPIDLTYKYNDVLKNEIKKDPKAKTGDSVAAVLFGGAKSWPVDAGLQLLDLGEDAPKDMALSVNDLKVKGYLAFDLKAKEPVEIKEVIAINASATVGKGKRAKTLNVATDRTIVISLSQ